MIKIGPLAAIDYGQVSAMLCLQEEPVLDVSSLTETGLAMRSLAFWQHWLPCQYHLGPSIYVAREEGQVLGFISLRNTGKSKECWRIDNLVIHQDHRGRGIAQELLRFVFSQFGSQGVSHFIAEVLSSNDAALSLFAACGFCRSAQVTYYKLEPDDATPLVEPIEEPFRTASPLQKQALYLLHQDALPPDLRLVLNQVPEDFRVKEVVPFTSVEVNKKRLLRRRVWYLVSDDAARRSIAAAAKITAQPGIGYRVDFAIHPGWRSVSSDIVHATINMLISKAPRQPIWVRVFDYQNEIHEALSARQFERMGDYFLLAREHWQRAKNPKLRKSESVVKLAPITNPAINFPLATDRKKCITSPVDNHCC